MVSGKRVPFWSTLSDPDLIINQNHMIKNYTLLIILILCAPLTKLVGQSRDAVISGRVVDGDTNEPLIGASVIINEKKSGVATGMDGDFILRVKQDEKLTINISFIGFETKSIPVEVTNATIDLGTIVMNSDISSLEVVTVRASLEGQQKALNQQRTSDNIKNVISSDLIGRFPDLNVAEALQRVPGINIQRDKGEGSTVSVRGTPPNFTTIQINGEQMPSVQQDGSRNEALDLIPADQLASMEITKAPTPDMDGDAIGGVVNLRTPVAKNTDLGLQAESALGYNDLSGGINGIGRLNLNKRFFATEDVKEGRLGILGGISYYSTDNSEDRIDADWQGASIPVASLERDTIVMGNYQYRKTENQRERIGATFTMDYKFNNKNQVVFNYLYSSREDNDLRNRLRFDLDENNSVWPSLDSIEQGRVRRDINIFDEVKSNNSFNLNGYHTLSDWQVDWGLFYTLSNRTLTSDRGDFAREGIDIVADNPGGIYTDVPNFKAADPSLDIHNPLLFNDFRRYEEDYETTDATNMVGKVDITKFFKFLGEYNSYLKFGSKVRMQTNSKFRDNVVFAINDPNNVLRSNETFLRVTADTEPTNFLYSDYRFGPRVGRAEFQNYVSDNRLFFNAADNAWDSRRLSLNDTYDAFEDIYSSYVMGRFQIDNLMVLAGLRYEYNSLGYDAFEVFRFGTDVVGEPVSDDVNYDFLLPNVHLKYSLDRFTAIRFSTVFNYARPNFVDIVPFVSFDADAQSLSLGNPNLKPADALNIDAMFERYFANIGVFSVGAFYKNINNFQFTRLDPFLNENFPGYPNSQGFEFRQEQNGVKAEVAGLEFNIVRALDFLPGILGNINLFTNYTYAYSTASTQDREDLKLPGQAAHTANGALSFDYKDFSTRVSLNYNGEFGTSLASQEQDDIVQKDRLQVDINASYNFSKHWKVFGELVNVTNAPSIRYQGIEERISRIAYFGWWTRVGVGFRL